MTQLSTYNEESAVKKNKKSDNFVQRSDVTEKNGRKPVDC